MILVEGLVILRDKFKKACERKNDSIISLHEDDERVGYYLHRKSTLDYEVYHEQLEKKGCRRVGKAL